MVKPAIEYASNRKKRIQSQRGAARYVSNNWLVHKTVLPGRYILYSGTVSSPDASVTVSVCCTELSTAQ